MFVQRNQNFDDAETRTNVAYIGASRLRQDNAPYRVQPIDFSIQEVRMHFNLFDNASEYHTEYAASNRRIL